MKIELHDPVGQLMLEVADRRMKQRDVAVTYAFIMRQQPNADWKAINAAIA
jgi:hypothetical protein